MSGSFNMSNYEKVNGEVLKQSFDELVKEYFSIKKGWNLPIHISKISAGIVEMPNGVMAEVQIVIVTEESEFIDPEKIL